MSDELYKCGSIELSMDDMTGIATICINNPKKRNCLNGKMMDQMSECITRLENWQMGRAVILYGKDGFFSSGADLKFLCENMNSRESGYKYSRLMHSNLSRLKALPFLSVAAIEGQALGGGAEICVACDMRIMTRSAKIGFVQIRIGVTPGWSGGTRLVHILGDTKAMDLLLSGRILTSEEALDLGLVDHLFADFNESQKFIEETKEWINCYLKSENICIKELKNFLNCSQLIAKHSLK